MRHVSPQSLANLRPVSATPERARAFAKVHGIGGPMDTRKRCEAPRKDGQPCRDLAAFGTPYCTTHGARRFKAAPPAPPGKRATAKALAFIADSPPPLELQRTAAYAAAHGCGPGFGATRRAALLMAWQTGTETGDWGPWRKLTS